METAAETLTAICLLVIGLSHIIQPRVWVDFFIMLREKEKVGSILAGLLHFTVGPHHCRIPQYLAQIPPGRNHYGVGPVVEEPRLPDLSETWNENAGPRLTREIVGVCGCGCDGAVAISGLIISLLTR